MEIDWWTLAIQTINFLVVVWLLRRFLYRPVRRMIEEREASDHAAAEDAQQKADEADRLRAEYERKLAQFEEEKRKHEAEFHASLRREREETLEAAHKDARSARDTARAEIEAARKRAVEGLRDDIAALAKGLATKALSGAVADPAARLGAELDALPDEALARMKQDVAEGGVATVVTANALSDEARQCLSSALGKRLGDAVEIGFDSDPDLIGGVVLRLPHGVLDASVAFRLDKAAATMTEGEDDA
jgi:F-type H+-transporting ATPase subunit b